MSLIKDKFSENMYFLYLYNIVWKLKIYLICSQQS